MIAFRVARRGSLIARGFPFAFRKSSAMSEKPYRVCCFPSSVRMHARVRCIGTRTRPRFREAVQRGRGAGATVRCSPRRQRQRSGVDVRT